MNWKIDVAAAHDISHRELAFCLKNTNNLFTFEIGISRALLEWKPI